MGSAGKVVIGAAFEIASAARIVGLVAGSFVADKRSGEFVEGFLVGVGHTVEVATELEASCLGLGAFIVAKFIKPRSFDFASTMAFVTGCSN